MLAQNPSQIYKADLRGHDENGQYRCLSTLNFGIYSKESRQPFGKLKVLNDEALAPQQNKSFSVGSHESIILLPLVGSIDYTDSLGNTALVGTEEILVLSTSKPTSFQLHNPYEVELINYLQIRLESTNPQESFQKKQFDFGRQNELSVLLESGGYKISIGIFSGRSEGVYGLQKGKGAFTFIINGAFEFQNRLLESRDALSIWEVDELEFEALSENAILLLIETTLQ